MLRVCLNFRSHKSKLWPNQLSKIWNDYFWLSQILFQSLCSVVCVYFTLFSCTDLDGRPLFEKQYWVPSLSSFYKNAFTWPPVNQRGMKGWWWWFVANAAVKGNLPWGSLHKLVESCTLFSTPYHHWHASHTDVPRTWRPGQLHLD